MGHGAGGGIGAKDIVAVSAEAQALGVSVALVEQPYLVAGRERPLRPRSSTPRSSPSSSTWSPASSTASRWSRAAAR